MAESAAATALLLTELKPKLAILAGIAGTYTDALKIGDTVIVASETIADIGRRNPDGSLTPFFQKLYPATFIPEGFPTAHSNTVNTAGGRNADGGLTGTSPKTACNEVMVENMEGAAFLAVCERFGVPAMEVRTISNRVGEPVTSENLDLAARNLAADLAKIIERL
jgi:futalosine hydrolase